MLIIVNKFGYNTHQERRQTASAFYTECFTRRQSGSQPLVEDGEAVGERLDVVHYLVADVLGHLFHVVVSGYIDSKAEGCNVFPLGLN